jgi:hypothetical protein
MMRFRCWHVVIVVVVGIVILTVAILCASGQCRPRPISPEQQMLAFLNRHTLLPNELMNVQPAASADQSALSSSLLPEERAAAWLIYDDPLQLDPPPANDSSDNEDTKNVTVQLRQRYVLLSLWYHSETPWSDKNPNGWLSEQHECDWKGVDCNSAQVITKLSLCCLQLNGQLPVDLALLTALTSLDFGRNQLTGTVPTEYAKAWPNLTEFFVGDNTLTGRLPDPLLWTQLLTYDVHANLFSSGLPADHVNDSYWPASLKNIYVNNNTLTGAMTICDIPELDWTFTRLVADCGEVSCECCTACCPNATEHVCFD